MVLIFVFVKMLLLQALVLQALPNRNPRPKADDSSQKSVQVSASHHKELAHVVRGSPTQKTTNQLPAAPFSPAVIAPGLVCDPFWELWDLHTRTQSTSSRSSPVITNNPVNSPFAGTQKAIVCRFLTSSCTSRLAVPVHSALQSFSTTNIQNKQSITTAS